MSLAVMLVARVVLRRVSRGEQLEAVLLDYPKLNENERAEVIEYVSGN